MTPAITPTAQAITNLWCITGNLDVPGGNVISRFAFDAVAYALPGAKGVINIDPEAHKKRIGADRYGPLKKFIWRAQTDLVLEQIFTGKPYPIKGMWIQTCNPVGGIGLDPKKWMEALKKLDFIVAVVPRTVSVWGLGIKHQSIAAHGPSGKRWPRSTYQTLSLQSLQDFRRRIRRNESATPTRSFDRL